ncbi:MAG TPA: response regulator [Opitutaceae bacterium]|nr:response regulator [Opitutaceae bacterium]
MTASSPASHSTAQSTLLVVDDEERMLKTFVLLLQANGFKVLSAAEGEEAMGIVQQSGDAIDAVITDVYMPRMDGIEFTRAFRALYPNKGVVVCSGALTSDHSKEFNALGGCVFLQKPFTMDELITRVKQALAGIKTNVS